MIFISGILAMNASTNILTMLATSPTATPMPEPIVAYTDTGPNPTPTGTLIASPPRDDATYPKRPRPVTSPTL